MDRLAIKHRLLDKDMTLFELSRATGLPYDRVVRLVNGYRRPKPEEVQLLANALDLPPARVGEEID